MSNYDWKKQQEWVSSLKEGDPVVYTRRKYKWEPATFLCLTRWGQVHILRQAGFKSSYNISRIRPVPRQIVL